MQKLNAHILTEDKALRTQLQRIIKVTPELVLSDAAGTVDVVLWDIRNKDGVIDGMRNSLGGRARLVVVGGKPEEAVLAYDKGAVDFVQLPLASERLKKALTRAIRPFKVVALNGTARSRKEQHHLKLKSGNKVVDVLAESVLLAQGMGNYVKIFMEGGNLLVNETMTRLEEMLPRDRFLRIHRSYIVSIEGVSSIGGRTVEWRGRELPLGGYYKKNAQKVISHHTEEA
jgi:DNA-binding LytR/AlgR family response regulator